MDTFAGIMNTKIYIIGSGAIGKALAAFLVHHKKQAVLIRGSVNDHVPDKERIIIRLNDQSEIVEEVDVFTLKHFETLDGIIVLTNKSFGNEKLAASLKEKTNGPIVLLQNGLGVERSFLENNFPEIYRCVLFATSQFEANSKLRFKPVATSPIGIIKGNEQSLKYIVDEINTTLFPFKTETNIQHFIWKKAIANSVFNSICPLLETDNGIFHRDEAALSLAKRIVKECVTIAQQSNVLLTEQEVIDNILLISKASDGQFISTLQDIRNKRETEIDTLNFEFARMAEKIGRSEMASETKLLGELIKLKSDIHRELN